MEDDRISRSIKTFVFLDIESTHLESLDRPKMMEICLVAVHRSELLETFCKHQKTTPTKGIQQRTLTPRVVDSLSLCFYPEKEVSPCSYQLTGLDNWNLSESCKARFGKNEASILKLFLARQEEPVCLLAHNGFKFDFPMIKTELDNINDNLSENILCGDTLRAFREMADHRPTTQQVGSEEENRTTAPSSNLLSSSGKDGNDRSVAARILLPLDDESQQRDTESNKDRPNNEQDTSRTNENSKKVYRTSHKCYDENKHRFRLVSTTDSYVLFTPEDRIKNPTPKKETSNTELSYSLRGIYKRTFKGYPHDSSHQASNDVMALIAVFIPIAKSLIEYFDIHSVPFERVSPYYLPFRRKRTASPVSASKKLKQDESI